MTARKELSGAPAPARWHPYELSQAEQWGLGQTA
jgi:hypothetical protein